MAMLTTWITADTDRYDHSAYRADQTSPAPWGALRFRAGAGASLDLHLTEQQALRLRTQLEAMIDDLRRLRVQEEQHQAALASRERSLESGPDADPGTPLDVQGDKCGACGALAVKRIGGGPRVRCGNCAIEYDPLDLHIGG